MLVWTSYSRALGAFFLSGWVMTCVGCFGNEPTAFPTGLEPLEPVNMAMLPEATTTSPYPEELSFYQGRSGRSLAVHAQAYVHAPLAQVWPAVVDPDVTVDRAAVDSYEVTYGVEDGYDVSYEVHIIVEDVITVEYDMTYRHSVIEGTVDAPLLVASRWQKTFGSTVISYLAGSLVAQPVDGAPDITRVEWISHLDSLGGEHQHLEASIRGFYTDLLARVRGEELPVLED